MKNFIDYNEEIPFEEEKEDKYEDEEKYENKEEFTEMKYKKNFKFDESNFDVKVAKSIVNIHRRQKENNDFSDWVEGNYFHLMKLYELSEMTISIETFFTYIYDHSSK